MFETRAPEIEDLQAWTNSKPLKLENLRGKVVLLDFWTYSCINCLRTLPHLKKMWETYSKKGLMIIGIHTPEFEFEKELKNVKEAVKKHKIGYPVALDNNHSTWNLYGNTYWPRSTLVDSKGLIRMEHVGEGGGGMSSVKIKVGHHLSDSINRELMAPDWSGYTPQPLYPDGGLYTGIAFFPEGLFAGNRLLEMQVIEFTDLKGTSGHDHRHLWEVVYINLKGEGRVKLQREGELPRWLDWNENDVVITQANEFHLLSPRAVGNRFMQIKTTGYFRNVGLEKWQMQDIAVGKGKQ